MKLVSDPPQDLKERHGRLLRYVEKGSADIGKVQLLRGHAEVYIYGGNPFQRTSNYQAAESKAKRAYRGMWRTC